MPITVVPGQKVGKVFIGARRESVINLIGEPQFTNTSDLTGLRLDSYFGSEPPNEPQRSLRITYSPEVEDEAGSITEAKVIQIEFNSPAFATSDGISTKSSVEQFRARFPNAALSLIKRQGEDFSFHQTDIFYDDTQAGITFQVVQTHEFDHDIIFIMVHPRHMAVLPHPGGEAGFPPDVSL